MREKIGSQENFSYGASDVEEANKQEVAPHPLA
jgi:hypothetical protein